MSDAASLIIELKSLEKKFETIHIPVIYSSDDTRHDHAFIALQNEYKMVRTNACRWLQKHGVNVDEFNDKGQRTFMYHEKRHGGDMTPFTWSVECSLLWHKIEEVEQEHKGSAFMNPYIINGVHAA